MVVSRAEPLPDDGIGEFDYGFILDDSGTVPRSTLAAPARWRARMVADLR
jgi:hypothetical protein